MNVAVTGAAGFIGSHTCEELARRGHRVVGIDSFDDFLYPEEVKRANLRELETSLAGRPFELRELDICDRDAMGEALAGADVVCHLAALAGVRPSIADPIRYIRTNLEGLGVVLQVMRETGPERLVFASSSSVYGSRAGEGEDLAGIAAFREDDPALRPASPYAATKRAGELLCSTARDLDGIGVFALRYFTVYGPRQRPDMAIHRFVRQVAAGEEITLFGDGSSRRDYTFVADVVAATVAACERIEPGRFEIYNIGGERTTSLAELVSLVEKTVGQEAKIHRLGPQPGDVPITFADIDRARADLGYAPATSLEDGLARFWTWYQGRLPRPTP
jgi:UDP-glucuronate 4-epimerase